MIVSLRDAARLRVDLDYMTARDVFWMLTSRKIYWMLVLEGVWSSQKYLE